MIDTIGVVEACLKLEVPLTMLNPKNNRVIVYDSTLREGEQMPGVRFTPEQKLTIAELLMDARVHQIEAGFAAISDEEKRSIRSIVKLGGDSDILSLSRARRDDIEAAVSCDVDMILIFMATSDLHLEKKLRMGREEVLQTICDSIEYARDHGVSVAFSTEDTTRSDQSFLERVYRSAAESGAERLGITDTIGCGTPEKISELVRLVKSISSLPISVHLHNDFGLALANAIAAVQTGAEAVATTVCGFGERAGNVPLEQFVVSMKYLYYTDLGIRTDMLTEISSKVSEFAGIEVHPLQPWVGRNVFAHESGIHVAAVLRDPRTYEFLEPEAVGNKRRIVLGKHSGRNLISVKLMEKSLSTSKENLDAIFHEIKFEGERNGNVSEEQFWSIVSNVLGTSIIEVKSDLDSLKQ